MLMRLRKLLLLSLLFAACGTSRHFVCDDTPRPPRNFGAVSANLYRGGQPVTCGELMFLRAQGVRSILKLNDRSSAMDAAEKAEAGKLGLRIESFDFNARTIGHKSTCTDVQHALAFLRNEENWPVFVHCTAGKDRTGYIVGMYERSLGRSITDVMSELHRYGHRGARSAAMSQIDGELQRASPLCAQ